MKAGTGTSAEYIVRAEPVAQWQPTLQPVWSDEEYCWCTSDHWIFRYHYATGLLCKVFRLPRNGHGLFGRIKDLLARSWLRRRFSPGVGIDTLVQLNSGDVVMVFDQVYWYSSTRHYRQAQALPFFGEPSLASPLRGGAAVHDGSQHVYFGEYLNGHQRDVRVARVDVARQIVEVCWTFSRSEIKHVHSIHYDRFRNRLWICTGDLDHESAFWYTDDEFQTVHRFAGGDQTWRAIAMLFDGSGLEWGMDAGQDAPAEAINRIFRYDFITEERTERAVVGNPAYAACEFGDGTAILQTTFEPKRQQATAREAALWLRGKDGHWRKMFELAYRDSVKTGAGNYGALLLPRGVSPIGVVLFTPSNCVRGNGLLHSMKLQQSHE